MAQGGRSKELWLVPKRVSLHQTICLIEGIKSRSYDGTSWNPQKQNNLGVNLMRWGATKNGRNISPQAVRTLVASIPQFLGFIYINTETTPNSICVTKAGWELLSKHEGNLVKVPNLVDGDEMLIKTSDVVLGQMEKLQITNPIILKDCENISLFPFRVTLKFLRELGYLDREEIAYFLLRTKDESEVYLKILEVKNFRNLATQDRYDLIHQYMQTHHGNITLVQASSASYYESLCAITGLVIKDKVTPSNHFDRSGLQCIKLNHDRISEINEILDSRYSGVEYFDFGSNSSLWIEYIGDPKRLYPPVYLKIENASIVDVYYIISKNDDVLGGDILAQNSIQEFPIFRFEDYTISFYDQVDGGLVHKAHVHLTNGSESVVLNATTQKQENKDVQWYANEIIEHSSSSNFSARMTRKLSVLKKIIGIDRLEDKGLRGAYYESLFYEFLTELKKLGKIDDVIWNGKYGSFGLPVSAPGGKFGTPDIVVVINNIHFVIEVTTIKSKSQQFSAEASSVPDHIRLYREKTDKYVHGVFIAPILHERVNIVLQSVAAKHGFGMRSITDKDFVNVLVEKGKDEIASILIKI